MNTSSLSRFFRPGFLAAVVGTLAVIAQTAGTAAAAAPTIVVEQPAGTGLTSGTSTVDFGSSQVQLTAPLPFTIRNTGTADLTIIGVTVDGTNSVDFKVTAPALTTVPAGGSTTFTVTFKPTATGFRAAGLHIVSNDATNLSFNIGLTGTGVAPVIAVEQPAGNNLTSGTAIVDFGLSPAGTAVPLTFTIRNSGTASLTGVAVTFDGTNSADYQVTSAPALTTVPVGGSTTFTVTFTPSANGTRTATLHIASNAPTNNPFNISLKGTGQAPVIAVEQPAGTPLSSGTSTVDFESSLVGGTPYPSLSFTIRNTGSEVLTGVAVTVTKNGIISADYTVDTAPATSVAAGVSTTFTVKFNPLAVGNSTATLQIASNDPTHNPFNIGLTGNGQSVAAPVIAVEQPAGTGLTSGTSTVDFGSSPTQIPVTLSFTIKNTGTAELKDFDLTIDGTNSADFKVTANPGTPVAAHGSTTFTMAFTPSAVGPLTATLHIASNDTTLTPFNIDLTGTGASSVLPLMAVAGPDGKSLVAGVSTADCGSCMVGASQTVTFTISNTGAADLTNLAVTVTRRSGTSTNYTVASPLTATVTGGGSTTFTVTFKPLIRGVLNALVSIKSNDLTHQPFNFYLTGMGMTKPLPVLVLEGNDGTPLISNTSKVDFGSLVVGAAPGATAPNTQVFTIKNTGLAGLTGITVTTVKNGVSSADFKVTASPAAIVVAADSTTFTVQFNPQANGLRTATLRIASTDARHNPFNIALTGTGMAPLIAVEAPTGTNLLAGTGKVNFGASLVGTQHLMTFTIRNNGAEDLNVSGVNVDGTNSADYAVSNPALSPVPGSGRTTFTVTFTPSANGLRNAKLHVMSNDPTHPSFDIALTGTGVGGVGATPMIEVEQPAGPPFISGETAKFQSDGSLTPISVPLTVLNILSVPGAKLKISKVGISGPNATEFKVTGSYGKTIAPGASTTIQVKFTPKTAGQKEAMLSIQSNAPGQSPYYVRLVGSSITIVSVGKPGDGGNPNSTAAVPKVAMQRANAATAATGAGDMSEQLMQAAADAAPRFVMVKVNGQDWPALSFQRLKSRGSLIYVVEESADMLNWSSVPMPWQPVGGIVDEGDGTERLTVLSSESITDGGQRFLRVRVQDGQ